ncbi:hypothetical protein [Polaribacter sp. Asnod1-A03]|uniref:hypothetical protein n=1 Tax=Polaribacter sp. Asnod1-A03 TaxID=3160581 RepID=UPI00386D7F2D
MKRSIFNNLGFLALAFVMFFASCKNDDPIVIPTSGVQENLEAGILNGTLDTDYTLDSSVSYQLTSSFIIPEGYTFTIPAGTKIQATEGGTDVYIAVLQGGAIYINGTESSPVVISTASGEANGWGGLTICGYATTSAGVDAEAEVGGFIYGGTDDTDNSGSISYLQIAGTGAQINAESQYNGISFYSVGSGTSVSNIAVLNGADDGVEFFGGAVSVTNLYVENTQDDAIDWTEEWSGNITNAYISHTEDGFSTVFEGDKANGNPTFDNITAISTVGGTALQFKATSGGTISGLSLVGYDIDLDMKDGGDVTNVTFTDGYSPVALNEDPATDGYFYSLSTSAVSTVSASDFPWVDTDVSFDTNLLQGAVTGDVTLDASIAYTLSSSYIVQDGGKLTIPAGTKITARDGGTGVYIAVLKGGEIDIQGTADNPVVMSSSAGEPGDWGGLTLCGNATTSAGVDAEAEIGGFIYGGTDDADSSGSIKYLVIKGTGAQINSESQYNGVSFYAVGSGTTVENVSVINGDDDGVEFFGGTVSVSNLYLENNSDDAIDWTESWSGSVTNAYISHTVEGFSTAFEGDKTNGNPAFTNITAISTVGGTALQFKATSGGTISNLYLEGYETNIDMRDDGPLANVVIDGVAATLTGEYNTGTQVDISTWSWINAGL